MFYKAIFFWAFLVVSLVQANTLEDIKSFQANFTQTITNSSKSNIEYKGEVFIKNSGMVLWKYKEPIIKNVYINNTFAIVDEPELEQAIFTSLENEINIIKLLQGAKKVSENIYKTSLYNVNYQIVIKDKKVSSISYIDELENSIEITFSNIKQNITLNNDLFKFEAPEYYDIIRK